MNRRDLPQRSVFGLAALVSANPAAGFPTRASRGPTPCVKEIRTVFSSDRAAGAME